MLLIFQIGLLSAAENSFYKGPPIFQFRPEVNKAGQAIDRFGPVGIGINLLKPAFVMSVKNIEKGSPADLTGKLKVGQIIESINGAKLAAIDPRFQLGTIITRAEETDGLIILAVRDKNETKTTNVSIKIPVLGHYSKTWPLNCKKSDLIVNNLADYLRKKETITISWGDAPAVLFMLSTGDKKDCDVVRSWVKKLVEKYKDQKTIAANNWTIGRFGVSLCEYYLRTGDQSVLHILKLLANHAKWDMYNNGWAHGMYRGKHHTPDAKMAFGYMGGGHMNACGVHMPTFLMMAKECGVAVDENTLQASLKQMFRFAGRGAVPYGDGLPEQTYVDNGRDGGLAFAMAAAASLTPEGEKSLYAGARNISAIKGFYSTSWMLIGHTGGGVGELWRSASMGLMYHKKPTKYREFMDNRKWFYELSRRFDGSFGILGGTPRYDKPESWAIRMGMSYTIPRKTLRLSGAAKTKFSKSYTLPKRPWGTANDDVFYSIEPAVQKGGKIQDIDAETLVKDASRAVGSYLADPKVSDETILKYAHHIDQGIRNGAAYAICRHNRDHLIPVLLQSNDARVRHAGAKAIYGTFKRVPMETKRVTKEFVDLLAKLINDKEESLWVVENSLTAIGQATPDLIAPHFERLLFWLGHEEWWLSKAAVKPLSKIVSDKRFYKKILDSIFQIAKKNTHVPLMSGVSEIMKAVAVAPPEIQNYANKIMSEAYLAFPTSDKIHTTDRIGMGPAADVMLKSIAGSMAVIPGGLQKLFVTAKKRYPEQMLPHKNLYLSADPLKLSSDIQKAMLTELIPEYIKDNISKLKHEAQWTKTGGMFPIGAMDGLAGLYRKVKINDYDWKDFGPDRLKMKWNYYSFDPKESKRWLPGVRFRKVTFPKGMEKWYQPEFNEKENGWSSGVAPFGQSGGKLKTDNAGCKNHVCRCSDPMKTLWEKEVLMIKGKFKFPKLKEDHRYRLLVGGASHVNGGDGYMIYINGKLLTKQGRGPGKREGGKPLGAFIPKALLDDFNSGEVTIAVISFLRMHKRSQIIGNYLTVYMQEMKMPSIKE